MFALLSLGVVAIILALVWVCSLVLDSIVYGMIGNIYQLFMALATARIFKDEVIEQLASRIYIIIGVVALFLVAYALLLAIINPDNASKGETSLGKVIPNIAIAIIGIALVPTIFTTAFNLQDALLSGPLANLILGDVNNFTNSDGSLVTCSDNNNIYQTGGNTIAISLFSTFFYVKEDEEHHYDAASIMSNDGTKSLSQAYGEAACDGDYTVFYDFFEIYKMKDGIGYTWLISTIAGVYACYVLLNFCFDVAVRSVKLAYLQILAPIPLLTNIIPGQKKIFQNWLKKTISCFLEVFVRLVSLLFIVYLLQNLPDLGSSTMWGSSLGGQPGFIVQLFAKALIIIGLLTFIKQAPKLLSDILGIDSKGFKLGIADKLGEMAFIGGAAKSGVNKITGTATGALGGAATGLFNKGVDTKAAIRTGAANGFAKGGNQFSAQREKTFQARYGYGANQGIFGGLSMGDKAKAKYGNDAKQSWQENAHNYATKYEQGEKFSDTFNHMSKKDAQARIDNFKNTRASQEAEAMAQEFCKTNFVHRNDPRAQAVYDQHLDAIKKNTTDENEKRIINTYQNDQNLVQLKSYVNLPDDFKGQKTTTRNGQTVNTDEYNKYLSQLDANEKWLAAAKTTTQGFADGTFTRKSDGTLDDIFDERYKADKGFATTGEVKDQSTNDLLRDLISKSGK